MTSSYPSTPSIASENTPTTTTNPCPFRDGQLHNYRVGLYDELTRQHGGGADHASLLPILEEINLIDKLRYAHENRTGCLCRWEVVTPAMQKACDSL